MRTIDLHQYDLVMVSSSAGKDSQAMLTRVMWLAQSQDYPRSRIVVAHADLGRVEWQGTRELAVQQAKHYGLRSVVVSRPQGDLLAHVRKRGMWPSPKARYCTSDHKRGQLRKVITGAHRDARAAGHTGHGRSWSRSSATLRRARKRARSTRGYRFTTGAPIRCGT
jgi:3'-phosphoadenosine 5'-phosphosulfate sulfotransferase (PAPS reductase)/FAD synthetase